MAKRPHSSAGGHAAKRARMVLPLPHVPVPHVTGGDDARARVDAVSAEQRAFLDTCMGDSQALAHVLQSAPAALQATFGRSEWTLLHWASFHGHVGCVRELLSAGADCLAEDVHRWTPVLCAAFHGHHECVRLMLANSRLRHNPNRRPPLLETPLHAAAFTGPVELLELLMKKTEVASSTGGRPVFRALDSCKNEPLHLAAAGGRVECARALVRAGANVNSRGRLSWTPIVFAVYNGHADVLRYLISEGAAVGAKFMGEHAKGRYLTHYAAKFGHLECMRVLLSSAAIDVNATTDGGVRTALFLAARYNHCDVIRLLLEHGADVDSRDLKQWTPLLSAAYNGHFESVRILLDAGADPQARDTKQWTAALSASRYGSVECLRALLERGFDLEHYTAEGEWTCLWLASFAGHIDCLRVLLAAGANVDTRDATGTSAVYVACSRGKLDVAYELVKSGANVTARHPRFAPWGAQLRRSRRRRSSNNSTVGGAATATTANTAADATGTTNTNEGATSEDDEDDEADEAGGGDSEDMGQGATPLHALAASVFGRKQWKPLPVPPLHHAGHQHNALALPDVFNNERLSDVRFIVGNRELYAHKFAVAQMSVYFHSLFLGPWSDQAAASSKSVAQEAAAAAADSQQSCASSPTAGPPQRDGDGHARVVVSDDVPHDDFLVMLRFFYTHELPADVRAWPVPRLFSLWATAERFGVSMLARECEHAVLCKVDESTVVDMLDLCQQEYHIRVLVRVCKAFLYHYHTLVTVPDMRDRARAHLLRVLGGTLATCIAFLHDEEEAAAKKKAGSSTH